jgi:hypothetical protein
VPTLYALVSDLIGGKVIDYYATREEAEEELRDALSDEPEWDGVLHVEPVEFDLSRN